MKNQVPFVSLMTLTLVGSAAGVSIDWAVIGNSGNAADPATGSIYGAVAYEYKISRNETTIAQYAEFLNAVAKTDTYGLYSTDMTAVYISGISRSGISGSYTYTVTPGSGNKPITYMTWFDAARFCNWLHNGQQTGESAALTAETGAYTLNGATTGIVSKNVNATVWIPSESEWYKAAYYDPTKNSGNGGYWLHANQSDTITSNSIGDIRAANYYDGDYAVTQSAIQSSINYLTEVGSYGLISQSYYDTNDQTGNVQEWTDGVVGSSRILRGGTWVSDEPDLRSSKRHILDPDLTGDYVFGFRVAGIPEQGTLVLAVLSSAGFLIRRRK